MALPAADALLRLDAVEDDLATAMAAPPIERITTVIAVISTADHLAAEVADSPSPYVRAVAQLHRAGARAQLLLLDDPESMTSQGEVADAAGAALDAAEASTSPNVRGEVAMGVIGVLAAASSVLGDVTDLLNRAQRTAADAAEDGARLRAEGLTELGTARGLTEVAADATGADRDVIVEAARPRFERAAALFARSGDVELYRISRP